MGIKRLTVLLVAAAVAMLAVGSTVWAMDVQPLRILLNPARGQVSGTISINNTRTEPLDYEILVERRIIEADGTQRFEPAEDDFIIFPPQGSVQPGQSQAARFQYLGPRDVTTTQGYVLRVKEVPVQRPEFSGVQFAYAFGVAVYVRPADARDTLTVQSVERTAEGVRLTVVNQGNDYALLADKRLRLSIGSEQRALVRQEFAQLVGLPLIAPNSSRILDLALPDLPQGAPTAVIDDLR
ncbi:fimbrial biogenesis chaperone [Sphingomonas sp. CJ99]